MKDTLLYMLKIAVIAVVTFAGTWFIAALILTPPTARAESCYPLPDNKLACVQPQTGEVAIRPAIN